MNSITFSRYFNFLMTVILYGNLEIILKKKLDILEDKGYLLGKEFSNHLAVVRGTKLRTMAIMKANQKGSVSKLFQQVLPSCHQRNCGDKTELCLTVKGIKMVKHNCQVSLYKQNRISLSSTNLRIKMYSYCGKRFFWRQKISRGFFRVLGKLPPGKLPPG